jgi:hypothetical protein
MTEFILTAETMHAAIQNPTHVILSVLAKDLESRLGIEILREYAHASTLTRVRSE